MRPEPQSRENQGPRINDQIRAREVRLIDENGQNVGVIAKFDALARAEGVGLDLVEISPDAEPPVCKILDFGKFKFQEQKKAAEARKNQKIVELKEIKMRPGIDDHDYDVKLRAIKRFFEEGDKVKITLRFRGREMAHSQLGMAVLQRVAEQVFPQVEHVTVSIGYARIGDNDYPATVLDRADKALYFAKENGRNSIYGYESLNTRGMLGQTLAAGSIDLF